MGGSCPKELVSMELLVSIAETAQGCGGHWSKKYVECYNRESITMEDQGLRINDKKSRIKDQEMVGVL